MDKELEFPVMLDSEQSAEVIKALATSLAQSSYKLRSTESHYKRVCADYRKLKQEKKKCDGILTDVLEFIDTEVKLTPTKEKKLKRIIEDLIF